MNSRVRTFGRCSTRSKILPLTDVERACGPEIGERRARRRAQERGDHALVGDRDAKRVVRPIRGHDGSIPQRKAELQREGTMHMIEKPPQRLEASVGHGWQNFRLVPATARLLDQRRAEVQHAAAPRSRHAAVKSCNTL